MTRFGLNVSPNSPFSRQNARADILSRAREISPAGTVLYGAMDGGVPPGDYVIPGGVRALAVLEPAEPLASTLTATRFRVPPGQNGLTLRWDSASAAPHVYRDRQAGLTWDSRFLALLRGQNGGRGPAIVRTLDWSGVNRAWQEENPAPFGPRYPAGTPAGAPTLFHQELGSALDCPVHLNVPHPGPLGARDYLDAVVSMVARVLPRAGSLYVEVGNEAWNDGFPLRRWLSVFGRPAAQYGLLCRDVFTELQAQFGQVVRPYVGGFLQDPGWLDEVLTQIPPGLVYAAGPAAYFGPDRASRDRWNAGNVVPGQGELRDACLTRLGQLRPLLDQHRAVAKVHGVAEFYCYEAGQSLIAGFHAWRSAALAAQREPWMEEAYRVLVGILEEAQVDVANWYSFMTDPNPPAPTDVFGMLERMDQDPSLLPKGRVFLNPTSGRTAG